MRSVLAVAGTELRLFVRDRSNIFFVFVFPLLLAVAAAAVGAPRAPRPARRWPVALALAVVLACAVWKLPGYFSSAIDSPDIHAVGIDGAAGRIVVADRPGLVSPFPDDAPDDAAEGAGEARS